MSGQLHRQNVNDFEPSRHSVTARATSGDDHEAEQISGG
jgi:hypothetical protein